MTGPEWTARELPRINITWECAACWTNETHGKGCTAVTMTGVDVDDVVLCDDCHHPRNLDILANGKATELPDGTPTWMRGTAVIDGFYRYHLSRQWLHRDPVAPTVLWLMLNPSTADESVPDQTISRIIGFTRRWGFGGLEVVNLFANRSPYPRDIPRVMEVAVGDNDRHIVDALGRAGRVIAAWGTPGPRWLADMVAARVPIVRAMVAAAGRDLLALETTAEGHPKHPLARGKHRIANTAAPTPWPP